MSIEVKYKRAYKCIRCQEVHYEGDGQYEPHKNYQDKYGISLRKIEKKVTTKQTNLVNDFKFPKVNTKLKIGKENGSNSSNNS